MKNIKILKVICSWQHNYQVLYRKIYALFYKFHFKNMIYYEVFETTYFLFLLTINKEGEFI